MTLLKEMLLVLDQAQRAGSPDDRRAADRLQRRCVSVWRGSRDDSVAGVGRGSRGGSLDDSRAAVQAWG